MPGTDFTWIEAVEALSPAALTVRAQAISPTDQDTLLWDAFFPRQDVGSVDLNEVSTVDQRPVADRREWNAKGRYIPLLTPAQREISIIPIESFDKIEEKEMQKLFERTDGNEDLIKRLIGASIPARTDKLVQANYRRLEYDAFTAWLTGTIVQRNPGTGQTYTASMGIDAGRFDTAGTAWSDPGVNAYNEFLAWIEDGIEAVGGAAGAALRLATLKAIQADAPQGVLGIPLTRAQLVDRITQDLGQAFRFYVIERSADVFTDGGVSTTRTKYFPAEMVALVPEGEAVGFTAFAPVVRAMQLSQQVPAASIDRNGVTVFHEPANGGRELTIEAQLNAAPVPIEKNVWVIDAGV